MKLEISQKKEALSLMKTIPQSISVTATTQQKSITGMLSFERLQLLTEPSLTHTDPAHVLEQHLPLQMHMVSCFHTP